MNYERVTPQTLLKRHRIIDSWFPIRYSLDLYRGCVGGCLYCPANLYAKAKVITTYSELPAKLERELAALDTLSSEEALYHGRARWQRKQLIGLGAGLHDPLMPLTGLGAKPVFPEVLELLRAAGHRAFILTKYPHVLEQFLTSSLGQTFLTKAFSTTSMALTPIVLSAFTLLDEEEERYVDVGGVPSRVERLVALQGLHGQGLPIGAVILSLAPWEAALEARRLTELLNQLYEVGVNFIILNFLFSDSMDIVYKQLYQGRERCPSLERFGKGRALLQTRTDQATIEAARGLKVAPSFSGELFGKEKLHIERIFRKTMRTLGLPFMLPPLLYRESLSPKDAIAATFIQMYYLLKDMGKRREFFKMVSYHLSQLSECDFADIILQRKLTDLPGIGEYCEKLILKMALKENYEDFDKIFLEWYQF